MIQCHNCNWKYEKVPNAVASLLIGDLKRILRCAVFLKENRILLLTEELDLLFRFELHECLSLSLSLELVNKVDRDHREPMHDMCHLNQEGMLQASQVMVQQQHA